MTKKGYFSVGKVMGFWGLDGDVKVAVEEGRSEAFSQFNKIFIETDDGSLKALNVERISVSGKFIRVKFKEITNANEASELKHGILYAKEDAVRKTLKKDEYLISDLLGLTVYDTEGKRLGVIDNVTFNGAQDIISIETSNGKSSLVPFVNELVPEVNLDDNYIVINPIDGLISQ